MKHVKIKTGKATIVVEEHTEFVKELLTIGGIYLFDDDEKYQLIGSPSQVTEEQWKGIVDKVIDRFQDYTDSKVVPTFSLATATESGLSLLKANGVDEIWSNPQLFIKLCP